MEIENEVPLKKGDCGMSPILNPDACIKKQNDGDGICKRCPFKSRR